MNNITEGLLKAGHEVKLLTICTEKHPFQKKKISSEYITKTGVEAVYIDTSINIFDALRSLFRGGSYNVERFYSRDFEKKIIATVKAGQFDIIHLESLFVTPYLPALRANTDARIVLRSHNVEFEIWEKIASSMFNPVQQLIFRKLAAQLKKYELATLNDPDGIAAITYEDMKQFEHYGSRIPIIDLPLGVNMEEYKQERLSINPEASRREKPSFFHLGSMDWRPNRQGIRWFLKEIWPEIHHKHPDVPFIIAGRNMPAFLKNYNQHNVRVVGFVENSKEFMLQHSAMIVPLLSGGGLRIKIIEAMALGVPVISTLMGARGVKYQSGKNLLIADNEEELKKQLLDTIENPGKLKAIGEEALELAQKYYDNDEITDRLISFYKKLLAQ